MESFCIDSVVLGTKKHLLCDNGSYSWVEQVPDVWHLDGTIKNSSSKCLDTLLKLSGIEIDLTPPKKFVASIEPFMHGNKVPWELVMPRDAYRDFLNNLVSNTEEAIKRCETNYYNDTWVHASGVLNSLKPACIDVGLWKQLMSSNLNNEWAIKTFKPNFAGFAENVTYDRFASVTGRLTVLSGPNILNLKREYRPIIKSIYDDGEIIMIDFSALEVRLLLLEAGVVNLDNDIYASIAQKFNSNRASTKLAVISEIYGSSTARLGETLQMNSTELGKFVGMIRSYFQTDKLLDRLKTEIEQTGLLRNKFGRIIGSKSTDERVILNHYAQSTGVDVSLLGFSWLVEKLMNITSLIRPLFVLHDAVILDVPGNCVKNVLRINSVKVKGYDVRFPVSSKLMNLDCTG